jgi:hypothetical protein
MELAEAHRRLKTAILDCLEVLTGEELMCIVSRDDDGTLTPWVLFDGVEILGDKLNGWVDNTPWNAPKSL